jgi:hypothetical protein
MYVAYNPPGKGVLMLLVQPTSLISMEWVAMLVKSTHPCLVHTVLTAISSIYYITYIFTYQRIIS